MLNLQIWNLPFIYEMLNQMVFDGEPSIGMPSPRNSAVTLTFDLKMYYFIQWHTSCEFGW